MNAPSTDPSEAARHLVELLLKIPTEELSLARAIGLHPKLLAQLTDKAIGLIEHGKLEEGDALLSDLSLIDAESATLPFLLGASRARQQRPEAALDAYGMALLRAERAENVLVASKVRICRAQSLLALGRLDEATTDLQAVAEQGDAALAAQAKLALERLSLGPAESGR